MSHISHDSPDDPSPVRTGKRRTAALTLGAVGVVYGDIGTSPLYAFREALRPAAADGVTEAEVLGVVSLLLWALIVIVTLKYVLFLLRADNRGEGGILALFALVQAFPQCSAAVFVLGITGAALFFGDAIITPAISVLSAVEGLKLITPVFESFILPIAVAGTAQIFAGPEVLKAFSPSYAIAFLSHHGMVAFVVLGAVFLAVTGAEALYADLGHCGRRPIQLAWFALVFPALGLNYLG